MLNNNNLRSDVPPKYKLLLNLYESVPSIFLSPPPSAHYFTGVITAIDINQNKSIRFQKLTICLSRYLYSFLRSHVFTGNEILKLSN